MNFIQKTILNRKKSPGGGQPVPVPQPIWSQVQGGRNQNVLQWQPIAENVALTDIIIEAIPPTSNNWIPIASATFGDFGITESAYTHQGLGSFEWWSYRIRFKRGATETVSGIRTIQTLPPLTEDYLGFGTARIIKAEIKPTASNILEITYSENVNDPTGAGLWLLDSSCPRPLLTYVSGSGTNLLKFRLADNILPGYNPTLIHWPEYSEARSNTGRVPTQQVSVDVSGIVNYTGTGTIRFVNSSGAFQNSVNSSNAGDYVLLQSDGSYTGNISFPRNGTSSQYITIGRYGTGAKPILTNSGGGTPITLNRNFVCVAGIHLRQTGSGYGANWTNGADSSIVADCTIEGLNSSSYAGLHMPRGVSIRNWLAFNNDIEGFRFGVRSSGFPYQPGAHNVDGGMLCNIFVRNTRDKDGINVQRGDFGGLKIRKCKATGFYEDGIDTYASDNIDLEHCEVYNPNPAGSGNCIKAGGVTGDSAASQGEVPLHQGRNVRVIGCYVHDADGYGISNNSNTQGVIEGNIIYNVGAAAITITTNEATASNNVRIERYDIRHNLCWNCVRGLNVNASWGGQVVFSNNIVNGNSAAISRAGSTTTITGGNNCFFGNTSTGGYTGTGDITGLSASATFVDVNNRNFRLSATSALIDAGRTISGYTRDHEGKPITNQHDIGPFERAPTAGGNLPSTVLHLLGDSLTYVTTPNQQGYGDTIAPYFINSLEVRNHGQGGASSVSYYNGKYQNIKDQIQAGHYVFIQFGPNDQWHPTNATTISQFQAQLELYNTEITAKGAIPVFLTPFERFQTSPSLGDYDDTVRSVAISTGREMLDAQDVSAQTYSNLGLANARIGFADETNPSDPTHFGLGKAYRGALMLISELNASDSPLKDYVVAAKKSFVWNTAWTLTEIQNLS